MNSAGYTEENKDEEQFCKGKSFRYTFVDKTKNRKMISEKERGNSYGKCNGCKLFRPDQKDR